MRSPVGDLLSDLAAALEEARIDWYLFGAQAAILYGAARLTADVDVTVRLSDNASNTTLTAAFERHRFRRRIADAQFIERTRVIPFVHTPTAVPTDVVIAGPGIEDQFFERVVERTVEGAQIRVVSAEDLVVMKILAARPKDMEDVTAVLAATERFDVAYVRRMLGLLEQALAQSDLAPAFEQVLERARSR
jgi:hypothetical protein